MTTEVRSTDVKEIVHTPKKHIFNLTPTQIKVIALAIAIISVISFPVACALGEWVFVLISSASFLLSLRILVHKTLPSKKTIQETITIERTTTIEVEKKAKIEIPQFHPRYISRSISYNEILHGRLFGKTEPPEEIGKRNSFTEPLKLDTPPSTNSNPPAIPAPLNSTPPRVNSTPNNLNRSTPPQTPSGSRISPETAQLLKSICAMRDVKKVREIDTPESFDMVGLEG